MELVRLLKGEDAVIALRFRCLNLVSGEAAKLFTVAILTQGRTFVPLQSIPHMRNHRVRFRDEQ